MDLTGGKAEDPWKNALLSEETKEERAPVVTECFLASDASAIIEYTNKVRCLARSM